MGPTGGGHGTTTTFYYYYYYYYQLSSALQKTNTYQAIIITDGIQSYTVFTYQCGSLEWSTNTFEPFSTRQITWSNVIYKLSLDSDVLQQIRAKCIRQHQTDIELFPSEPNLSNVSPCPCSLWQAFWNWQFWFFEYTGDSYCGVQWSSQGKSWRCCYSLQITTWGALLITKDDEGSSLLLYNPFRDYWSYRTYDEGFRDACCGIGLCDLYYERRPVATCNGYVQPFRGAVFSISSGLPNFVLNMPSSFRAGTAGLLGNFNGNQTDDLMFPNKTVLTGSSVTDRMIHAFGQSWQVSSMERLFTNATGQPVFHPEYVPLFADELNTTGWNTSACRGDTSCIYDYIATGRQFPPALNGSNTFVVTIGVMSVYSFVVTDDSGLGTRVSIVGGIPRAGNLTNISNAFTFSWNPTTSEDVYGLTFYATDSLGATGILRPKVYVCSCLNGGNCIQEGMFNSTQNVTMMQCNCPAGYTLQEDGRTCTDIDECVLNARLTVLEYNNTLCVSPRVCNNLFGSYECTCPPGTVEPNCSVLQVSIPPHSSLRPPSANELTNSFNMTICGLSVNTFSDTLKVKLRILTANVTQQYCSNHTCNTSSGKGIGQVDVTNVHLYGIASTTNYRGKDCIAMQVYVTSPQTGVLAVSALSTAVQAGNSVYIDSGFSVLMLSSSSVSQSTVPTIIMATTILQSTVPTIIMATTILQSTVPTVTMTVTIPPKPAQKLSVVGAAVGVTLGVCVPLLLLLGIVVASYLLKAKGTAKVMVMPMKSGEGSLLPHSKWQYRETSKL
eukprot:Em0002g1561a